MSNIGTANRSEWSAALRLLFQHLGADEFQRREAAVTLALESREIDPSGLIVARDARGLVGAVFAAQLPGSGGAIWPPSASQPSIADQLVRAAIQWLNDCGVNVVQTLLSTDEMVSASPLLRSGFQHITSLWYLVHDLELPSALVSKPEVLHYMPFSEIGAERVAEVLSATYVDSLDCPEISRARSAHDAIEAHCPPGGHRKYWWIAKRDEQIAGLVFVNPVIDENRWEIAYIGVVPEFRRLGFGKELLLKSLFEAKAAGVGSVGIAVDSRNWPARSLYRSMGFEPVDCKDVLIAVLNQGSHG